VAAVAAAVAASAAAAVLNVKSFSASLFVSTDTFAVASDAAALALDASANFAAASAFSAVPVSDEDFNLFAATLAMPACLLASSA